MPLRTSLAAALVALGGAGVAVADENKRAGTTPGLSTGLTVVKVDGGGYGIRLS